MRVVTLGWTVWWLCHHPPAALSLLLPASKCCGGHSPWGVPTEHVVWLHRLPTGAAGGAVDKAVSGATSAVKALPTKGLSTPSVPRAAKKAFTPPTIPKKDIGVNASE